MNPFIENAKRQSLTKRSGFGFIKQIVPALAAAVCCLLAVVEASATDITSDIDVSQDTTIENINGGHHGDAAYTIYIAPASVTLTLNNTSDSYFGGEIGGPGNVEKTGPGTLYLEYKPSVSPLTYPADLYYRGTTKVSGGTLNLNAGSEMLIRSSAVINNGVIETNKTQTFKNLSGNGTINVTSNVELTFLNTDESEYSGSIVGVSTIGVAGYDSGELTLSGTLNGPSSIYVSNYGHLKLTGSALNYNGPMTSDAGTSVDYCVKSGTKRYDMTTSNKISANGKVIKSGDGTLQICCASAGLVSAESMFISSGRLDYQGYFQTSAYFFNDCIVVEEGGTLSPGIGVGNMTLNQGNLTIQKSGIALFEFDAYNENPSQQNFDTLVLVDGRFPYSFTAESGSIIDLAFLNNDASQWAKEGAEYHLVTNVDFEDGNYDALLPEKYRSMFSLKGKNGDGLYLIGLGAPEPEAAVPEPSTWALLILGAAGLICVQLRKKK